ncbi:MAG: DDE-type integrase/transposase/recombinase [archaeon]
MINAKDNKKLSENKIKCRYCKSENFVKKGFRQTENRGKIQKFFCKECNRFFTNDEGFFRMRYSHTTITLSIDMYLSNLSSRKMRNQLKRHFNTKVSHMTILEWVRKYALKVHNFVEKLGYNLGQEFFADETFIRRQKQDDRFWACVDYQTRFITGIHYSISGNIEEAKKFISKSVKKGKPKFIQTDSAQFYPKAFKKLFYTNKVYRGGLVVEHKIQNVRRTHIHNYKIETVFMKIKDRVDDFRGLKALWSAPIIMVGLTIQHNFIEEHTTLKNSPCCLAGQDLDLGDNRWLGLIKLASRN